jgi:hypothetical protein
MVKKWRSGASRAALVGPAIGFLAILHSGTLAQDFSVLRINEVISDNETTDPTDSRGIRHDMVEIFNSGDVPLTLGSTVLADRLGLSDTETQPALGLWTFPSAPATTVIPPRGFLIVFLEDDPQICDLHANFALARDGTEPITLWGRAGTDGKRPIIDQVWLPPLDGDVSFGRHPDGAGPAPVPQAQALQVFGYHDEPTFGACTGQCAEFTRACTGAPNKPWANLAPSVSRAAHSTNHPAAGEAVEIIARVKDDKVPTPPNIARVHVVYVMNDGSPAEVDLTFDDATGVVTGESQGQPLDRWTFWKGSIPGQPEDARVEFTLHVRDAEGLSGADPSADDLCEPGKGPCNVVGEPGPGCEKEPSPGLRFQTCDVPFAYLVGYEPPERLRGLVVNEVMAAQTNVIRDPSDAMFDDWFELFNGSGASIVLDGLWVSDKAFRPQGWKFPPGSSIEPGERLLVWADGDGGLCPRPLEKVPGDGQDCPDPTTPALDSYHTSFALEKNGDELYLFEELKTSTGEPVGFGVIHGVEFGVQEVNVSLSLIPDGDPAGEFVFASAPTPRLPNRGSTDPLFLRGEADGNCIINLTDAIFILNHLFSGGTAPACPDAADTDDSGLLDLADGVYLLNHLFQGGPAPKPPGLETPGADPTDDDLDPCQASCS